MNKQVFTYFFALLILGFTSCDDGTSGAKEACNAFMTDMIAKPTNFDKLTSHYAGIKKFSNIHKVSEFVIGEASQKDGKIWVETKGKFTSPKGENIDRPFSLILEKNGADYEIVDSKGISDFSTISAYTFAGKIGCYSDAASLTDQEMASILKKAEPTYEDEFKKYFDKLEAQLSAGKLDLKKGTLEINNASNQTLKWVGFEVTFYNFDGKRIEQEQNLLSEEILANSSKTVGLKLNKIPKGYARTEVSLSPYDYEVSEYFNNGTFEGVSCPQ